MEQIAQKRIGVCKLASANKNVEMELIAHDVPSLSRQEK